NHLWDFYFFLTNQKPLKILKKKKKRFFLVYVILFCK
ncbi:unnamed protein product, partial [Staurois parvus]